MAWWRGPRKGRELVAYIATCPGGASLIDACMAVFWKLDRETARKKFHDSLGAWHMRFREVVGDTDKELSVILRSGGSDHYRLAENVQVDLCEFQHLRQKAMATSDATTAIGLHIEAAAHVRGTLLEGTDDYHWSVTRRADFERDVLVNLGRMERLLSELGLSWRATVAMERILKVDPTMESVARRLMETYAALGHPELAQREYQRLRKALEDELRKPSPATNRDYQRIRREHGLP